MATTNTTPTTTQPTTTQPTTTQPPSSTEQAPYEPLHVPEPPDLHHGATESGPARRRPWVRLLVALLAAVLGVYWAGQVGAGMWREDLDARLLDAGAGANAAMATLEREHLEAYRAMAYAAGLPESMRDYDAAAIEALLTPIDANHAIPMVDVIDLEGRVVFAFRAKGTVQPIYRERRRVEIVQRSLMGELDEFGPRFTELITTQEGPLVATAGPVRDGDQIVGALLLMTPLNELLSLSTNLHGTRLTAYALDRGDAMVTTAPAVPRSIATVLRERLSLPERLPQSSNFTLAGQSNREQLAALVVRHRTAAFVGASLPDRSAAVARNIMLVAALAMAIMSVIVASVVYAWARDRFEHDDGPLPDRLALTTGLGARRSP